MAFLTYKNKMSSLLFQQCTSSHSSLLRSWRCPMLHSCSAVGLPSVHSGWRFHPISHRLRKDPSAAQSDGIKTTLLEVVKDSGNLQSVSSPGANVVSGLRADNLTEVVFNGRVPALGDEHQWSWLLPGTKQSLRRNGRQSGVPENMQKSTGQAGSVMGRQKAHACGLRQKTGKFTGNQVKKRQDRNKQDWKWAGRKITWEDLRHHRK